MRTLQNVALFGLISLAPMGLLMVTAFVRINVVLILLRQALGSPQVPGNQILTALALLLTALVMHPIGEKVYRTGGSCPIPRDSSRLARPGRPVPSRSRRSWSTRSCGPSIKTISRRSTNMRSRPAPATSIQLRSVRRTFRCASWRRRICSAS